jgi:signal transduction histidine kinase
MNEPLPVHLTNADLRQVAEHVASDYDDVLVTGAVPPLQVTCDRQRTEQILHNLVDNAERSSRSLVEIRLDADHEAFLVARVVDDGPGVAADVLPRLFEAFGPTAGRLGNGLGLHVSRETARAQGGDLVLESSGPDGCVFTLTVPRVPS